MSVLFLLLGISINIRQLKGRGRVYYKHWVHYKHWVRRGKKTLLKIGRKRKLKLIEQMKHLKNVKNKRQA